MSAIKEQGKILINETEYIKLKKENKKLRECVGFYANGGNSNRDIWFDEKLGYFIGKRAKETLKEINKL